MSEEKVLKQARVKQSAIIQNIYRSASNPDHWQHFLDEIVDVFDGRSARLLWLDRSASRVQNSFMVNTDPAYQRQYNDYYVNLCPWRPEIRSKPPGQLYSSYYDFSQSQEDFHRSEFYHDWARPQAIEHGIGGTIYQTQTTTIQLLLQRTAEPGHFTFAEKSYLNDLVPHLRQAFKLQQQVEQLEAQQQVLSKVSGSAPLPFILIAHSGKTAYLSPSAESLLQQSNCQLRVVQDKICLRPPRLAQRLENLMSRTLQAACGRWDNAGGILSLPRHGERQLDLHAMPIKWEGPLTALSPTRCYAVIYLHDRLAKPHLDQKRLATLYALTPAEIRLACWLAQGRSLTEIAQQQKCSIHTLRNQAKSIYAKTGVSGQTALLRLLLTGPAFTR